MTDLLREIRDKAKDIRDCIAYVRSLSDADLKWIYERIGIDKPPKTNGKLIPFGSKKKRRLRAARVPIEIHAAIMSKLWPKIYGERWPAKKPFKARTAAEAVAVYEKRAASGLSLWLNGRDDVEITDRKRLFHRQGHQFAKADSNRKKNGKWKVPLSKTALSPPRHLNIDDDCQDEDTVRRFMSGHQAPKETFMRFISAGTMQGEERRWNSRGEVNFVPYISIEKSLSQKAGRKINPRKKRMTGAELAEKLKGMRAVK